MRRSKPWWCLSTVVAVELECHKPLAGPVLGCNNAAMDFTRRTVLAAGASLGAAAALGSLSSARASALGQDPEAMNPEDQPTVLKESLFQISLAQWSLHNALWKKELDNRDFAKTAKAVYGIHAIEYVNSFFKDKVSDQAYLKDLRKRADEQGVKTLLIMIDGEGDLGHGPGEERGKAIDAHKRWIDAAKVLGCHSIRVNAHGHGSPEDSAKHVAECLRVLGEHGAPLGIHVIVENHGGLSSDGSWLAGVMKAANHPYVGTLPDFGNFRLSEGKDYDRYKGVQELMPFAKAVSAKSYDFNEQGNETTIDYRRMLAIVAASGYRGHIGIEYEGSRLSEKEGILATKKLLEAVHIEMQAKAGK